MSRASQAFAQGQPAFSWRIEKVPEGYKATCKNHPTISATGKSEQTALQAAQKALTASAEKVDIGLTGQGQKLTTGGVEQIRS